MEHCPYVLKSRCRVEELQLGTADRLEPALTLYSIVASSVADLQGAGSPKRPCPKGLVQEEWQALYRMVHPNQRLPQRPPSLKGVVNWLGKLGGSPGRAGDRGPGVKILWQGFFRLHDFAAALRALQNTNSGVVGNAQGRNRERRYAGLSWRPRPFPFRHGQGQ